MNLKIPVKISLLMAVVVFAYVLCLLEGLEQRKQITTKLYRSGAVGLTRSFVLSTGTSQREAAVNKDKAPCLRIIKYHAGVVLPKQKTTLPFLIREINN